MVELTWQPERCRQVVRTDEHHVEAVDVQDAAQVRRGKAHLDLEQDERLWRIGRCQRCERHRRVAKLPGRRRGSPAAAWRETSQAHGSRPRLSGADARDDDARGAEVEGLADFLWSAQRNPHERGGLRRLGGSDQVGQTLRTVGTVLEVEDDEVPARPAKDFHDLRAWRLHPGAVQHLPGGERLPKALRVHEPGVLWRRILIVPATQTFWCWLQSSNARSAMPRRSPFGCRPATFDV